METSAAVASAIAERIVNQAVWNGDACSWRAAHVAPSPTARQTPLLDASFANGTAGIAFFLTEQYRHAGDMRAAHTARGALAYTIGLLRADARAVPGFHYGRAGAIYALTHAGLHLNEEHLLDAALQLASSLEAWIAAGEVADFVEGLAGVVAPLLYLAGAREHAGLLDLAVRTGLRMIDLARREPVGWSWRSRYVSMRPLCGMAHGASGCASAFLELYRVTGLPTFAYAAEQAIAYERQWFDAVERNWPDFRYGPLDTLVRSGDMQAARAHVRRGALPPPSPKFTHYWCHGAPGIGLVRLQAYAITGEQKYLREAEAALETTCHTLAHESNVYHLCHGRSGQCALLLQAADMLARPDLHDEAARSAWHRYPHLLDSDGSWLSGQHGWAWNPGFMLGGAGIGYCFLRLAYSTTTPALLSHVPPLPLRPVRVPIAPVPSVARLARTHAETYFGNTLRILRRFDHRAYQRRFAAGSHCLARAHDMQTLYHQLLEHIGSYPKPIRGLLSDAFLPDQTSFLMTCEIEDVTEQLVDSLRRPLPASPDRTRLQLSPFVRLVETRRDWESWLQNRSTSSLEDAPDRRICYLLCRRGDHISRQRVSLAFSRVLQAFDKPRTLAEALAVLVAEPDSTGDEARSKFRSHVYHACAAHALATCDDEFGDG